METSLSPHRRKVLFAGFAVPLFAGCARVPRADAHGAHLQRQVRATAPIDMPAISVADFSSSPRFPITDFGAAQDDQHKTSTAIARAIAAANADPEMCENVLVEDCVFDQGDDAISVKSGRDRDAWRLGAPCRNIVMRNCRVKNGHQLMAIGSELTGGIENVFVDNCHFDATDSGAKSSIQNLLFVKTNERRGGFVRNIHMSNVSATGLAGGVLSVETDVLYQWRTLMPTVERRLTPIQGLHVSGIEVANANFICHIKAEAEMPVRDVSLRDVRVRTVRGTPILTQNVQGFVNHMDRRAGA